MLADGIAMMYGLDRAPVPSAARFGDDTELDKVFAELGSASFGGGLYRVHAPELAPRWTRRVEEAFPQFRGRVVCFGSDWLGRQFAVDRHRRDGRHHLVLLLEPGTGEALEIPATVAALHTDELVHNGDAALAIDFYADWREATGDDAYLEPDECVGYDVPLFLGGDDDVSNLSRIDMDVYWAIIAQLRHGTLGLRPGATIRDVVRDG